MSGCRLMKLAPEIGRPAPAAACRIPCGLVEMFMWPATCQGDREACSSIDRRVWASGSFLSRGQFQHTRLMGTPCTWRVHAKVPHEKWYSSSSSFSFAQDHLRFDWTATKRRALTTFFIMYKEKIEYSANAHTLNRTPWITLCKKVPTCCKCLSSGKKATP